MMPALSYIIPFFKGEDTIIAMLDSIYTAPLPLDLFEVIIVDDCSPVPAALVLKEYVLTHSNIRVMRHKVNKCQGGAKNTGIFAAKGKYVVFADQDDVMIPENLAKALQEALKNDVDMMACHYVVQREDGSTKEYGLEEGDGLLLTGKEFCEQLFTTGYNLAPWANLYKREFLFRINRPYEESVVMEDSDWIAWHWIHADKVGIFNEPIYNWIMNPLSVTHSLSYINRADWVKYGWRKIRDAKLYRQLSPVFSDIMYSDGYSNIVGGMKRVWKVDSYYHFYQHLGTTLKELKSIEWHGIVKVLIHYPNFSIVMLSIIGPILKTIRYAKHKLE